MVSLHGNAPYNVVTVHGGPGAIGSLNYFSRELSERGNFGVVESLQTRCSVKELIEELKEDITENGNDDTFLIGHSWGAWLSAFFAAKYPDRVKKLILIGCPPITEKYVPQINSNRLGKLNGGDKIIFEKFINGTIENGDWPRLVSVIEKCDNYCLCYKTDNLLSSSDAEKYDAIWKSAALLRKNGELLSVFKGLKCEVCFIHGKDDPHPYAAIKEHIKETRAAHNIHILEQCGHNPFYEKFAKDVFYGILLDEISS